MGIREHLTLSGIWKDSNPHSAVPEGALSQADDVVFRRAGEAEPRPGFKLQESETDLAATSRIIPFANSSYLTVGVKTEWPDGTEIKRLNTSGGGPLTLTWDDANGDFDSNRIRGVEARKNLYLTTADGVRKVSNVGDTDAPLAGLARLFCWPVSGSAGNAILDTKWVAYRVVLKRTDANNLILRGPPSGRAVVHNTSGSDKTGTVRVFFPDYDPNPVAEGDIIEVYRSLNVDDQPSDLPTVPPDDLFLATIYTVTSTDVTNGGVEITDNTPDADLKEILSTSPSATNGGIEREHTRAPLCYDLALFKGSLFFSRITYPHRIQIRWTEGDNRTGLATGIGYRSANLTATHNSTALTSASSTVGVKPGMIVVPNTDFSTSPVTVTSVVGSTINVNTPWTGSTGSRTLSFYDSIKINNRYFPAVAAGYFLSSFNSSYNALPNSALIGVEPMPDMSAYTLGDAINPANTTENRRTVIIENLRADQSAFTIQATHGSEYEPALPEPSATAMSSTQDVFENGVAWTIGDEPEHTLLGYQLVGKQQVPIVRIVATRDNLWLLKGRGDGIYRLNGAGELSGWSITQFDPNTHLLSAELVTTQDDVLYAWTNKGVVAISDAGVVPLSDPAFGSDVRDLQTALNEAILHPGVFAVSNAKANEVLFGIPALSEDGSYSGRVSRIYCFNTRTTAWSNWLADRDKITCAAYLYDSQLAFGLDDTGDLEVERLAGDEVRTADYEYEITITDVDSDTNSVTIDSGSGWEPTTGDLINVGAAYAIITAVDTSTEFTVSDSTGITTGSGTAFVGVEAIIKWTNKVGDSGPGVLKRFQDLLVHFQDANGVQQWDLILDSTRNYGSATTLTSTRTYSRDSMPLDKRILAPRKHALSTQLFPKIRIRQADARWRLTGLTILSDPLSTRVSR